MQIYNNLYDPNEIKKSIENIDCKIQEEYNKDNIDNDKILKLRFQQLMKGLYLSY